MKPIGTKILTTARLVLRPPEHNDAEQLARIKSLPMSDKEAKKAVEGMMNELLKPFVFHWVITRQGNIIGRIKAWDVNPYNGYLQLGYDMAPDDRGNGYMTEALQSVLQYLLIQAEANRVYCSVRACNIASRRVCEKLGMLHEGTLRQHYARQDGGYDDVCIYSILRSEWIKGK